MKFRFKKVFCVAAVFLSLMLATCSDPSTEETGEGFFTINLSANENARAVYPPANPGDLKFTVKFKNTASGAVTTFITEGSGSIQDKIDVGNYIVTMDVTLISDGSLYARGVAFDNPVAIGSGQNSIRVYAYDVGKAEPPVISTKPSDSLNISISLYAILSGYSASISDGGTLSFQWFSNTTNSNSGGTPLPSGSSQTTGSTGSALTDLIPATTPEGLTYYYAEITNSGGSSASGPSSIKTKPFAVRVINGKGTVEDPFLVYDVASLQRIGSGRDNDVNSGWSLDAHYKQVEDIDLAPVANWTPIGSYSRDYDYILAFTGSYDGNGKTISNLTINASAEDWQGLFAGVRNEGVVKNVELLNCTIVGSRQVGGVVGLNFGTVQNCYVTSSVSGYSCVGGVVGRNVGTVQNCYKTGQVAGHIEAGGVIGSNQGTVQNCYNTGYVLGADGGDGIGGVVGYNAASVKACYNTGDVSGDSFVGGVVGCNIDYSTVQNCYSTGTISGDTDVGGGVVGSINNLDYSSQEARLTNCVALNKSVAINQNLVTTSIGRVIGESWVELELGTTIIAKNYGRSDMQKNGSSTTWTNIGPNDYDGASITSANWGSQSWWTTAGNWDTAGWDFIDIWEWGGSLPILRNMPGTAKQNPAVVP